MNIRHLICLFAFFPLISFGQVEIGNEIDSLKYVQDMPYICRDKVDDQTNLSVGCGDHHFWDAVKLKEKAIPFLLDKLSDATMTAASVPNFAYNYAVADVAYTVLEEIIHGIPTFDLLGVEFDQEGCGYCAYWKHVNMSYLNRINFKNAVRIWYQCNKDNLVWVENDYFSSCDCSGPHPNGGHYELKK